MESTKNGHEERHEQRRQEQHEQRQQEQHEKRQQDCLDRDGACVLAAPDLDGDGQREYLLCNVHDWGNRCYAYARGERGWRRIGESYQSQSADGLRQRLLDGQVRVQPRRWGDLRIGEDGELIRPDPVANCDGKDCEP